MENETQTKTFEKVFEDIVKQVVDVETGLQNTVDKTVEDFISKGINIDPKGLFDFINLAESRIVKIMVAKQLCMAMGLQAEMDRILEKELELAYSKPAEKSSFITKFAGEGNAENIYSNK